MDSRQYQTETVKQLQDAKKNGVKSPLIVLPTGAGKGYIAGMIAKQAIQEGKNVLFVIHKVNLLADFRERFKDHFGLESALWQNGKNRESFDFRLDLLKRKYGATLTLATLQTLASKSCTDLPYEYKPDIVIWDEAHHVGAQSWSNAVFKIRLQKQFLLVGMTATPARIGGVGLGQWFDHMINPVTITELIAMGFLVNINCFVPDKTRIKRMMESFKTSTIDSDYTAGSISEGLKKGGIWGDIVKNYYKHAKKDNGQFRKTVVFCRSIADCQRAMMEYTHAGVRAFEYHCEIEKDKREEIIADLRSGLIDMIITVDMVSEGFDCPDLEIAVLLCPTKSIVRYLQMVGRVWRICEGKQKGIVIDHVGNVLEHGLPDEDREWLLTSDKQTYKKKKTKQIHCENCGHVSNEVTETCENCGEALVVEQPPKQQKQPSLIKDKNFTLLDDGELVEATLTREQREKREFAEFMKELNSYLRYITSTTKKTYYNPYRDVHTFFGQSIFWAYKNHSIEEIKKPLHAQALDIVIKARDRHSQQLRDDKKFYTPQEKRIKAIAVAVNMLLEAESKKNMKENRHAI